jgi:NADP-dependent 3-hydroxy acid dehydrogenase YdfG
MSMIPPTTTPSDRKAVVTGASAGIGLAVARTLCRDGYIVYANARRHDLLDDTARDSGGRIIPVPGDITDSTVIDSLLERAEPPDVWVVNAGQGLPGTLLTSDESRWREIVELNVLSALRQLRTAATSMIKRAQAEGTSARARDLVVIGSVVGRVVSPFNPVYGATKFALHSAAESLRQEVGKHFVRVTVIEPGIVRTEFQTTAGYDMSSFNAYEDEAGPYLNAEDIAALVGFVVAQPRHVNVGELIVRPTRQVSP